MAKKSQTPLSQICFRQYAKTEKRKVGDAVDDPIADQLARAQNAEQMAEIAIKGGIPREVVEEKASKAPNPGQFRMTLGNLLRGVLSRVEQYHTLTGGRVDAADVGTKKLFQAKMAEWRKANKPVKDGKKPTTTKSASKKGGKVSASKSGKSAGDDKPAAAPKGAPSKSEAASRGKGKKDGGSAKKSRWQRNKASKQASGNAAAAGVDEQSGEQGEQTGLADQVAAANA